MTRHDERANRFPHGVASADPDVDRVEIWTRVEGQHARAPLTWIVARDGHLSDVVRSGSATPRDEDDHTVQVSVDGLRPDTHYWYAFETETRERSPVGRLRTLPGPNVEHVRFGIVSCAKFNSGFFNGYARLAERDDLNFVLHLGDYIYEASQTPPPSQTPGADIGRPFDPPHECKTLADYRRRYAQYRSDPDTQALHHAHSLMSILDDHELADGAWKGGSDEHKPDRDGPWEARRAAAFKAWREWLPARLPDVTQPDRVFRDVRFGSLAHLFLLDTRSRRDPPLAGPAALDPERSQLGADQRAWLFENLGRSSATWTVLGNSSVLGRTYSPGISEELRPGLRSLKLIGADGGPDADQWDGYPAERDALLEKLDGHDAVVLSGDIHVAMGLELQRDAKQGRTVATEFVTTSLTSQNLDDKMGWGYRTKSVAVERLMMDLLPGIRWCDMDSHGYMVADLTRERFRIEWWFVQDILNRVPGERLGAAMEVRPRGARGGRDQPILPIS